MGGKLGTTNAKEILTVAKLAAISFLQSASKDGVTAKTLIAPLSSETFLTEVENHADAFLKFLPELAELDLADKVDLAKFGYACWMDVRTEYTLAMSKIRERNAKKS